MTTPAVLAPLRSRSYLVLLVFAAIIGAPISVVSYGFLQLVANLQVWIFSDLPSGLGFQRVPAWWPLPPLALAGVLVSLTIRYLPGRGGESPAEGFKARGAPSPIELPGIAFAALATLGLGAVLGPEAPLIALGGGLAFFAVRLAKRDAPERTGAVVAAGGSFAAVSTLLGSPILGAFLLMEASGLAGPTMALVMVPGLLAAGVGSLVFIGLDAWTGLGTTSLGVERRLVLLTPLVGLAYSASLSGFRGGPVFPAMFLGAAGGMAMSHLPGLSLVPAVGMGIGAMCVVILGLPMTSVLLATLLLYSNGLAVMPLVILAVVVGYVASVRLASAPPVSEPTIAPVATPATSTEATVPEPSRR